MPGFGNPATLADRIAEQATIDKIDETAEHTRALHRLLREALDALAHADPQPKYLPTTLDPNQEVIVAYEGRDRYAVLTTDTAGTTFTATFAGKSWNYVTTAPGWVELDLPPGTRLTSGDANRHFIVVRVSNLKA